MKDGAKDEKDSPTNKMPKLITENLDKKIPDEENIREFASPQGERSPKTHFPPIF